VIEALLGGAADPAVADRQLQDPIVGAEIDVHDRRVRVLGRVGQRF
jgi:hypothetical protein